MFLRFHLPKVYFYRRMELDTPRTPETAPSIACRRGMKIATVASFRFRKEDTMKSESSSPRDLVEQCRIILLAQEAVSRQAAECAMVTLAHIGSTEALAVLQAYRSHVPEVLRGFFECAFDECAYFLFSDLTDSLSLEMDESEVASLLRASGSEQERERLYREQERKLAARGIEVNLLAGVPVAVRLEFVRRLSRGTRDLRFEGGGVVVFDGCSGCCQGCFQRVWCDLCRELEAEPQR